MRFTRQPEVVLFPITARGNTAVASSARGADRYRYMMGLTDLVPLLLQLHGLVEVGDASLLLRLPVQLQGPHLQLQLLTLALQLWS